MTETTAPAAPAEQEAAPRLSVIGTGYLGATHAACMAELGFEVLGVDVDPAKIERLARGEVPFHEPGLPELLRTHVASGRLRFTTDVAEAARWADVHFIGVGTPQKVGETAADLSYVDAAVASLAAAIDRDALIVGKSTVPVGTARRLAELVRTVRAEAGLPGEVELAWNPEFLREGFAVRDTLTPDRLVIGMHGPRAEGILRRVYARQLAADTPWISTDLETAELVKVAANAFLATKISFINAFSEITENVGGDIGTLADAIGHDARIGRRFLNAGVGFGGGCLPKDIRALQARVSELGLDRTMRFLAEVDDINLRRRDRVVDLAVQVLSAARDGRVRVGWVHAIRHVHSTGLAFGSHRHRAGRTVGGDVVGRRGGRVRRVGLGLGIRPLPHRPAPHRRGHPRGMDVDVRLRGHHPPDRARSDVHGHELPQSDVPRQGRGHRRPHLRRSGADGNRRGLVRARMACLRIRLPVRR